MEFILLIPVLIACYFLLYILAKQDFVLLRQNISLAQILDTAIIAIVAAFITGRLLFLVNNLELSLLQGVRFLHFIKFPGISPLGFFLGGIFALWFFLRRKKGILRIFDIFSISFFPFYSFSLILKSYLQKSAFIFLIAAIVLPLIFFVFSLKSHYKYMMRDGSISLITLLIISIDTLFYEYINPDKYIILFDLSVSQILSIILISSSIVFLFLNQRKLKV